MRKRCLVCGNKLGYNGVFMADASNGQYCPLLVHSQPVVLRELRCSACGYKKLDTYLRLFCRTPIKSAMRHQLS
jgi:C4-type Zn-finger protein